MEAHRERVNIEIFTMSFENNLDTGISELDVFKKIIKKVHKDAVMAGFKNKYTKAERSVIEEINTQLFGEEVVQNISNVHSNLTYVPDYE